MNYFVEGLQGSGKSTLVSKLQELHPELKAVREGEYSPVELAWCAYLDEEKYPAILEKYPSLRKEIEEKTYSEGDKRIVTYTKIRSEDRAFYQDLEQYEIYNNRLSPEDFRKVILERFSKWNTDNNIFECSLFQNIVEDMILFQNTSDQDIVNYCKEIRDKLSGKHYRIIYLLTEDIPSSINTIRKERSDEQGNELWFPMMLRYFDESPYAKKKGISGVEAMLSHFKHRQELEISICKEIFPDRHILLKSKNYKNEDIRVN
jgi:hypothetical protein